MTQAEMLTKFNPAVPRHWLFVNAAIVWTAVGLLLCGRAVLWLDAFSLTTDVIVEAIGITLAAVAYTYGISKIVDRNIDRIGQLPERACLFAFTPWRGYFMIALMVTLGIMLRTSSIPKYFLSVPYTAMGGALMIGSFRLYRQFRGALVLQR